MSASKSSLSLFLLKIVLFFPVCFFALCAGCCTKSNVQATDTEQQQQRQEDAGISV